MLSRYSKNPERRHWAAVKRIFRYLRGTTNLKLEFRKDKEQFLEAYSDADWANEYDDRRSITGNVIKFQHGAISWSSKKQKTTCQEVLWLRMLAQEIDATAVSQPTIVYCDNKSAIDLAETSAYRQRTKHIDVRHHFLREKIEDGEISINHIPTDEMTADSLTKPLFKQKHETCAKNMGLVTSINICSRGRMLAQEIDATAVSQPTIVYCDNKSAIDLAETSAYRQRTKHIDVRHHFLREKIEDGEISINHIPTDEMTADSLTKPLFKQKHDTCAKNQGDGFSDFHKYMFKGEC
ncbi:hypothetical protein QE152_g33828 [Popillia japonica]|uniref:Polyprotein n=1 Tax=Popillia japonica TaxID=7064 RepID=A0AAW1IW41_POPJA